MKHWFFLIGYWLVHTGGVFPLKLKDPKEKKEAFHGRRTPWKPWISCRRGLVIGIFVLFMILANIARGVVWHLHDLGSFDWNYDFLQKTVIKAMLISNTVMTLCCILTATIRRRGIEELLNNVSSLYFNVFKSTDPPVARKFACLISYVMISIALTILVVLSNLLTPNTFVDCLWQISHVFAIPYTEATSGVILIYLQSAIEGLNTEIKSRFPYIDEFDPKNWEPASFGGKNHRRDGLRKNAKYFLAECRRKYRSVAIIVDHLNSLYGFLRLVFVICNQMGCLAYVLCCLILLEKLMSHFDEENNRNMVMFGINSVWSFVRISMICHTHEIVVKEVQVTKRYMASIDASEIDHESKIELLEFLDEIDGREIRLTASNVFSLDYATLYLVLTNTIIYIIIVIQHLSS